MKTKKCEELGTITYRLPNIPEAMTLLGEMGLTSKKMENGKEIEENELIYMARMITKIETFITKIDIKIGKKKITKYEDVLKEFSLMGYISEIAMEIFGALNGDAKKKS